MSTDFSQPPNIDERIKKAQEIYKQLDQQLLKENDGKYIAIEDTTGKYFIGETKEEAVKKANEEFPNAIVFVRRIGSVEKVAAHSPLSFNNLYNARLL